MTKTALEQYREDWIAMKTALEQNREDQALGAAWRRCEAALPENWNGPSIYQRRPDEWHAYAVKRSLARPMPVTVNGATPTEALTALAEALEKREADLYASNMEWEHEVGV